jgi:hypothetical protein
MAAKIVAYPPALVERVTTLYGSGLTQAKIAAEIGRSQRFVWCVMKLHQIQARPASVPVGRVLGPLSPGWKGDEAKYLALHTRLYRRRGKPSYCAACDSRDPAGDYEWANLTGRYEDPSDFVRLCVRCHRRLDAAWRR